MIQAKHKHDFKCNNGEYTWYIHEYVYFLPRVELLAAYLAILYDLMCQLKEIGHHEGRRSDVCMQVQCNIMHDSKYRCMFDVTIMG